MNIIIDYTEENFSKILLIINDEREDEDGFTEYDCVDFKQFINNKYNYNHLPLYYYNDHYEGDEFKIYCINDNESDLITAVERIFNIDYNELKQEYGYIIEPDDIYLSGYIKDEFIVDATTYIEYLKNIGKTSIEKIFNLAKDYYGEENVDMQSTELTIKYPEVTIENSHGKKHLIRDLYVRLHFINGQISSIRGMRTTFLRKEYNCNYIHSHLPRRSGTPDFRDFCLGNDTPIRSFLNKILQEENEIYAFFTTLDSYVSWESLEGGPYIRMSEIGNSSNISISRMTLKKNLQYFLKKYDNIPVTYDTYEQKCIVDIEKIKPMITKISTIVGKELSGGAFEVLSLQSEVSGPNITTFSTNRIFKSQNLDIKIYNKYPDKVIISESIDYNNLTAHPNITNCIINEINTKLHEIDYVKSTNIVAEALRSTSET